MGQAPSVVIAHGNDLVRDMLGLACARGGVLVVGEAQSYDDLLRTCLAVHPDVALAADRLADAMVEDSLSALVDTGARMFVLSADPSPERPAPSRVSSSAGGSGRSWARSPRARR